MPKDSEGNYMIAYNYKVNVETTYGNSIYPGNYVDIYFIANSNGKIMYGKLATNVKVLAVKDSSGKHVFENINENLQPSQIILAVTSDLSSLLRVSESIQDARLILVPTNVMYRYENEEEIIMEVDDSDIKAFIEQNRMS